MSARTIGEVGEFEVIDAIRLIAPSKRNGDDAAVLTQTTPNARYVASTDMLVEGRHFSLEWSTPQQVGEKAAIQNFADIEAMGARPTAMLFGISAPPATPLTVVEGIAEGLWTQGQRCAAELVGGDVVSGDGLVISITAMGELGGPMPALMRSHAKPGENVIASGQLGYSAAGLALLRHFGTVAAVPEALRPLVSAHLVPSFTYGRGTTARAAGTSSLTDNSDGLIVDLTAIATASSVTLDISASKIAPDELLVAAGEELGEDPWQWIYSGGEDHTLIGTCPGDAPTGFETIGKVVKSKSQPVLIDGHAPAVTQGWVSF